MVSLAVNIINIAISTIQLIVLIISLFIWRKGGIKFERGYILIFLTLTLGFIFKDAYCIMMFDVDWDIHDKDDLKFVAWNLSSVGYLFTTYSFDMTIAKVFSLFFALARRRLSKAIKLIKITNSWIFWIGVILCS